MASQHSKIRYEVITQKTEGGGIQLPIPMVLLKELGWKESDNISFVLDEQGRYILRKT